MQEILNIIRDAAKANQGQKLTCEIELTIKMVSRVPLNPEDLESITAKQLEYLATSQIGGLENLKEGGLVEAQVLSIRNAEGAVKLPVRELHRCQNCEAVWDADDLEGIDDLWERVSAGEKFPSGECPNCNALCHAIEVATGQQFEHEILLSGVSINGNDAPIVEVEGEFDADVEDLAEKYLEIARIRDEGISAKLIKRVLKEEQA